ncbi:MAG: hypothetical protein OXP69_14745 [Spirochaetaceae bacterium]|nr:hypothetical protein [Spirochaetaceae bacterium]
MKHGRTFAELALVAAVLLVAACSQGPGEPPKPAWSPPSWMHGSWMVSSGVAGDGTTPVTGTVEVSARNLVANFQAAGQTHKLDLAMLTEQGTVSIELVPGVSDGDARLYGILITPNAEAPAYSFICGEEDSTTMSCTWTVMTPPDTDGTPLATVVLKKQ